MSSKAPTGARRVMVGRISHDTALVVQREPIATPTPPVSDDLAHVVAAAITPVLRMTHGHILVAIDTTDPNNPIRMCTGGSARVAAAAAQAYRKTLYQNPISRFFQRLLGNHH